MHHGINRSNTAINQSVFEVTAKESGGLHSHPQLDVSHGEERSPKTLRAALPNARFFSGSDIKFHSIAESSATATEGQLVVYRIGTDCPSRVIADALARGVAGILTEQLLPCPIPQCIVGDLELAMAELKSQELGRPDRQLLTIGVIGSAGKTTTSLMISSLLRSSSIRTAYQTDLGASDGIVQSTSDQSMPTSSELVKWLGEANDSQCRAAVMELSEEEARHGHYDAIEFDIVVVTGSESCSGDFGPSGLQCILDRVAKEGVVITPADDAGTMRVILDRGVRTVSYGVRQSADLSVKIIEQSEGMNTMLVTHQDTTAVMESSLCGPAMAANYAAAMMVGLLIAEPLHGVVEKLSQLRSIPGRGQSLPSNEHANVIIDAGGSPERAITAMRTYRSMKASGKLWCVLAIDANLSPQTLARFGTHLERLGDQAIVTATTDTRSKFLAASHCVLDGVKRCAAFRLVASRQRAIEWAVSEASANDTILLITGERHQSAHHHRSDLGQITQWVQDARDRQDQSDDSSPIKLSIFG